MNLSRDEILLILDRLAQETIVESSQAFPYRVTRQMRGYSNDQKIGSLQAKLSIMLEIAK